MDDNANRGGRPLRSCTTNISADDGHAGSTMFGSNEEQHTDHASERSPSIKRYLQEGDSSTSGEAKERENFDKGSLGMRQFLEYW